MLHQVTKPTPWRRGATLFRTPGEDTADGRRTGTKFQERSKHWQVGEGVQDQFRFWEGQELRSKEEVLPPHKVMVLKESSRRM